MQTVASNTRARAFVLPPAGGNVATPAKARKTPVAAAAAPKQTATGNVATYTPIDPSFVPSNEAELAKCLADPVWRVCSGQLYKIMVKRPPDREGDAEEETLIPFIPNAAQRRLMSRLWYRNIILKARQLGFTTLICILWLDHALFNHDQRCGVIAQDRESAEAFFRDKVKVAYNNLPKAIKDARPLLRDSAVELLFAHNNSSIRVATSMRSGTIHRLLVSEHGKICANNPDKAREVRLGSLPAVPLDGIAVFESTAEGQEGDFFDMTTRAIEQAQRGVKLTQKDFRIHFYAWWADPGYRLPLGEGDVVITDADREYFAQVEAKTGTTLSIEQRRWYVATRDSEFSGEPEAMWQEYPSFAAEAFQVSTEGCYYAKQLADARKEGRICNVPWVPGIPVHTFWDIGNTDGTAIWFMQRVGFENRFIDFMEDWGESYSYYTAQMQRKGYTWGTHYLPHDAAHKRQQGNKVASPEDELRALNVGGDWVIVPAVDEVIHGIQKMRDAFGQCWFDAEKCKAGLVHLGAYRKTWNKRKAAWQASKPSKVDGDSEAADGIRQFAQGFVPDSLVEKGARSGNWRTA